MYRCKKCGGNTKSGESIRRVVVKTREKNYPPRKYELPGRSKVQVFDPGGVGHETVSELAVCGMCEFEQVISTG